MYYVEYVQTLTQFHSLVKKIAYKGTISLNKRFHMTDLNVQFPKCKIIWFYGNREGNMFDIYRKV